MSSLQHDRDHQDHRDQQRQDRQQGSRGQGSGGQGGGGQVSEVSMMDQAAADDPIQPDQSVAGSSDDEPGRVDEGAQGPNANPNAGARAT